MLKSSVCLVTQGSSYRPDAMTTVETMDTERFSRLGYDVTAIDLSDRFVKLARERVPSAIVQKMDMRYLAFPGAVFDGVWASFSLLHIRANEIRKALDGLDLF
jgi:ubiquinone/menaquinone biosynthesis C-methylase UbiE